MQAHIGVDLLSVSVHESYHTESERILKSSTMVGRAQDDSYMAFSIAFELSHKERLFCKDMSQVSQRIVKMSCNFSNNCKDES